LGSAKTLEGVSMGEEDIGRLVFTTHRLKVYLATVNDAPFIHKLWTDPRVMRNVGFPNGLPISLEDVKQDILNRGGSVFNQLLVIRFIATGELIGQCIMKSPNDEGIAETDVKLDPTYWGQRFGVEIKRGLLNFLFNMTDCTAVQATPTISNIASIKMQEAVGGVRVGEAVYEFPESMRDFTTPVHHYIYRVTRQSWLAQKVTEPLGISNHEA
jgi:RimJ/RimL family protein N-acetyltransferase